MRSLWFAVVVCIVSGPVAVTVSSQASLAEDVDASRFEVTAVASGLVQPMELDIAPDGRIFLIELSGKVKLVDPKSGAVDVVCELAVTTAQENGLIGLALDPNFADNGWIYLQYSPPDFSGQYISRFDFRDGKIDLSSEKRLFSYEEQRRECCHHAGSLEFGPDGNLYIGTGDNTNPFNDSQGYAPIDDRENREPWDAQRTAGNTKSYNGKVLRIRPEPNGTYSIPDGNLFPKDGSIGHPEIYVMGCRNPWRISIDKKSGYLYWGDVGPDAGNDGDRGPRGYDEVNQARAAGNFGWPYFIGNNFAYAMVDFKTGTIGERQDPSRPVNRSTNNSGAESLPPAVPAMIYYPSGNSEAFPEMGSGGRTACAGPVYHYDASLESETKFPAAYDRTLFAFEWSRSLIYAVHLDADSNVQRIEPFLTGTKFVRPIDLQFDAGGALYVIEYGETWGVNPDARLVRIDYVRGNRSPIAKASSENAIGRDPLDVRLSAKESSDKDGDALSYEWRSTRTGEAGATAMVVGQDAETTVRFDEPGVYTIELKVTDPAGASAVTTLPVIVGNARPLVSFLKPRDGDFLSPGETLRYSVVVRDIEDGTSDVEEAEEGDLHFIESTAPNRLQVEAIPVKADANEGPRNDPPGLALMRQSDCFNCHASNRQLVGPSFVDIANKYRDQPHQVDVSVQRVMQGSTGVWGKVGMLPHASHTAAQVQQMVEYVFSVTADRSNPSVLGFNNELAIDQAAESIRLEATYTDLGRDDIPKLSGTSSVTLRSRKVQAEAADESMGAKPLGSGTAEGKRFMGAIEHDGFLKFNRIALDQVGSIVVRVASAGAGGAIEVHRGSVDGPLVGTTSVEVNGNWEAFYEKTISLESEAKGNDGQQDVYFVFKNEKNRGGLMNVDSIEFKQP